MTPSQLKYEVESRGTEPYFFTRKTMQFFGDTMRNYGVIYRPVTVNTHTRKGVKTWELFRRRPVKFGNAESAYFDVKTFKRVFPEVRP